MHFSKEIIEWYHQNKRDLPWRNTKNPYKIWLSEVILQQTRVVQGLDYYLKFINEFPSVNELANAEQDKVLKLWQGLGYYSRARNLHFAAKQVVDEFKGKFPSSYEEIKKLKGVGDYTAAAVASFAFNEPKAVVDGNVYRVLARYFNSKTPIDSTTGKKEFTELAFQLLDKELPSTHNQAIMEFGALQCTPKSPNCNICPLRSSCGAFKNKTIDQLPVKAKKTKQRNRYFNYLLIRNEGSTFLKQRGAKDIWQGLFEFPLIETSKETSITTLLESEEWERLFAKKPVTVLKVHNKVKHVLSHQVIHTTFIEVTSVEEPSLSQYQKVNMNDIERFAVPVLIEKFIDKFVVESVV